MDTGDIIKCLRKRKGLTQQELADLLGVQKSSVQKYECGRVQNLKLETIQNLCKIFQVAPYAFVFPDAWKGVQITHSYGGPDFYVFTAIFSVLTDEGKQKVLDYLMDLSEIPRYIRDDIKNYEELYKLFMDIGEEKD